jgi:hypothetical protein
MLKKCNWRNYCDECVSNMTRTVTCVHSYEDPPFRFVGEFMALALIMAAEKHDPCKREERVRLWEKFAELMHTVQHMMNEHKHLRASQYTLVRNYVSVEDERRGWSRPYNQCQLEENDAMAGAVIRLRYRGQGGCRGTRGGTSFTVYLHACSLFERVDEPCVAS